MTIVIWLGTALLVAALIFQSLAVVVLFERVNEVRGYGVAAWAFGLLALRRATALYLWTSASVVTFPMFLDKVAIPASVSVLLWLAALHTAEGRAKDADMLSDAQKGAEYRRVRTLVRQAQRHIERSA